MNLIAISGKANSGKNTIASIINKLTNNKYEEKSFANKLKDIVCLLIGCTREELEDREFKEKELSEEWWYYTNTLFYNENKKLIPYLKTDKSLHNNTNWYIIKLTPRLLLQLLGTECGRQIIHPNIWINSLFVDYKGHFIGTVNNKKQYGKKLPNWIITDLRFKNELEAIKNRNGIIIRINRNNIQLSNHLSETDLDNSTFDYVIDNDSSIEELEEKIKQILLTEKII